MVFASMTSGLVRGRRRAIRAPRRDRRAVDRQPRRSRIPWRWRRCRSRGTARCPAAAPRVRNGAPRLRTRCRCRPPRPAAAPSRTAVSSSVRLIMNPPSPTPAIGEPIRLRRGDADRRASDSPMTGSRAARSSPGYPAPEGHRRVLVEVAAVGARRRAPSGRISSSAMASVRGSIRESSVSGVNG